MSDAALSLLKIWCFTTWNSSHLSSSTACKCFVGIDTSSIKNSWILTVWRPVNYTKNQEKGPGQELNLSCLFLKSWIKLGDMSWFISQEDNFGICTMPNNDIIKLDPHLRQISLIYSKKMLAKKKSLPDDHVRQTLSFVLKDDQSVHLCLFIRWIFSWPKFLWTYNPVIG